MLSMAAMIEGGTNLSSKACEICGFGNIFYRSTKQCEQFVYCKCGKKVHFPCLHYKIQTDKSFVICDCDMVEFLPSIKQSVNRLYDPKDYPKMLIEQQPSLMPHLADKIPHALWWTWKEVGQFFIQIGYEDVGYGFLTKKIDGTNLLQLRYEDLIRVYGLEEDLAETIAEHITALRYKVIGASIYAKSSVLINEHLLILP